MHTSPRTILGIYPFRLFSFKEIFRIIIFSQGKAGKWGDYSCNTPTRTVDILLEEIKKMEPDIILYSGMCINVDFIDISRMIY